MREIEVVKQKIPARTPTTEAKANPSAAKMTHLAATYLLQLNQPWFSPSLNLRSRLRLLPYRLLL
jgi:hypothetical protein